MAAPAVDNSDFVVGLRAGARTLGIGLSEELEGKLSRHFALLERWGAHINLTAIHDAKESAERHFLDSLALLPEIEGVSSLLDLGSGAGFPGVPLKLARPGL